MKATTIKSRPADPATRAELDADDEGCCHHPACDGTHMLGPNCHPNAPVHVTYTSGKGILRLLCSVCQHPVAAILVAERRAN